MLISEVLDFLNEGNSISDLAKKLNKPAGSLLKKLKNSCVEFDNETNEWLCSSNDKYTALNRDITKTIKVLKVDKELNQNQSAEVHSEIKTKDKEYELFLSYRDVDHSELTEKKSLFLTEENYELIKSICKKNSFKINGFIHVLLETGLKSFNLKNNKGDNL